MACGIVNPNRKAQLILRDSDGVDVVVLDLLDYDSGQRASTAITLGEDMENLYHTPITQVRKNYAYQEGSTLSDYPRTEERVPKITIITKAKDTATWERIESLLWRVLSTRYDCFLRLYSTRGWRELKVRRLGSPSDKTKLILGRKPFREWKVELLACDPFWYSEEIAGPVLKRSDMTLASGAYTGMYPLANPCDQRCYLQWASGQITTTETWTLPDADAVDDEGDPIVHQLPSLGAGKEFLVDTYPDRPTLWTRDLGQDWARMNGEDFDYWLEPSTPEERMVPVKLVGGTADSQIQAFFVQRWDRWFGGEI
jgi:hypothetical protein